MTVSGSGNNTDVNISIFSLEKDVKNLEISDKVSLFTKMCNYGKESDSAFHCIFNVSTGNKHLKISIDSLIYKGTTTRNCLHGVISHFRTYQTQTSLGKPDLIPGYCQPSIT